MIQLIQGVNDLMTKNPVLAQEWHPNKNGYLKPNMVTEFSNKKVWWKCSDCGFEWETIIRNRSRGCGCPQCNNAWNDKRIDKLIANRGSLVETNPDIALEWDYNHIFPLVPEKVTAGSNKKVWWKCDKGHEWRAKVSHITDGHGCPYCDGQKAIKGINDILTTNPELALEWDYEKNTVSIFTVMARSGKNIGGSVRLDITINQRQHIEPREKVALFVQII